MCRGGANKLVLLKIGIDLFLNLNASFLPERISILKYSGWVSRTRLPWIDSASSQASTNITSYSYQNPHMNYNAQALHFFRIEKMSPLFVITIRFSMTKKKLLL